MGQPSSQAIGLLYDKFEELIFASLTSDHIELRDNVIIENNSDLDLAEGYCIRWGASTRPNVTVDCPLYVEQEVIVTITQQNNGTDEDRTSRKDAEKKLLGHRDDVFKVSYNDSDMEGLAIKTDIVSDNGIQDIVSNNGHPFMMIEIRFTITYKENL